MPSASALVSAWSSAAEVAAFAEEGYRSFCCFSPGRRLLFGLSHVRRGIVANHQFLCCWLRVHVGTRVRDHVRDDAGYWHQVETYVHDHTEAEFSHGLCPDCIPKYFPNAPETGDPS